MANEMVIGDLKVRTDFGDGEPRIRDLDLGRRLGYPNPIAIRKVIRPLWKSGKLAKVKVISVSEIRSDGFSSARSTEFWLDQKSAMLIATRSGTEKAEAVTEEMIDLFIAYHRGELEYLQRGRVQGLLLLDPCEWDQIFPHSLAAALAPLYGCPYRMGDSHPRALWTPYAMVWEFIDPQLYAEVKRLRNEHLAATGVRLMLHQFLKPDARGALFHKLATVEALARTVPSKDAFWRAMAHTFPRNALVRPMLQMPLLEMAN